MFCNLAQTHSLTVTAQHFGLTRNAARRQLALLERQFKTELADCRRQKIRFMDLLYDRWHQRIPLPGPSVPLPECIVKSLKNWHQRAHYTKDFAIVDSHGPDSQLVFHDQTPGPGFLELRPGQPLSAFAET